MKSYLEKFGLRHGLTQNNVAMSRGTRGTLCRFIGILSCLELKATGSD